MTQNTHTHTETTMQTTFSKKTDTIITLGQRLVWVDLVLVNRVHIVYKIINNCTDVQKDLTLETGIHIPLAVSFVISIRSDFGISMH